MSDFEAQMQRLRAEYRVTVLADIHRLLQQAAELNGDERDRPLLQGMIEVLHRMAGGAGVFGLDPLSEQARVLELALIDYLASPLSIAYREELPEMRDTLADLVRFCG